MKDITPAVYEAAAQNAEARERYSSPNYSYVPGSGGWIANALVRGPIASP
jgi:hypothetical protein